MRRARGEWYVFTDSADPSRSVNRSMFAFRHGVKAAIVSAQSMAIDFGAERVTVMRKGTQAGVFTGVLWVQVTDPTLARAIEKIEEAS